MTNNIKDSKYEQLYEQLLERGEALHESNKRRIRRGLIGLVILPVILGFIIWITGSSKLAFLIIWIFCMFALCIYLISIEYLDDSIQKTLEDVSNREADFDELLPRADLQERIMARITEIRAARLTEEAKSVEKEAAELAACGTEDKKDVAVLTAHRNADETDTELKALEAADNKKAEALAAQEAADIEAALEAKRERAAAAAAHDNEVVVDSVSDLIVDAAGEEVSK